MLQVSKYMLSYLNGKDEVVKRFELSNSINSSSFLMSRTHIIQLLIHTSVLIMIFLNLGFLSNNYQILILILKAIQLVMIILLIIFMRKLAHLITLYKIVLHLYYLMSHLTSMATAYLF